MHLPAALALLVPLGACGAEPPGADAAPPTNLILISLDTCRADRLSSYGAERETPHLDRFAAEAVRFDDCLATSCVTAPSHLSMLTGHYVHRHGLKKNGLTSTPPYSLASVLKQAGLRTAAFTGHGSLQAKYGHGKGFDVFQSWIGEERWPHTRNLDQVVPHAVQWLEDNADEPFFLFLHGYDPHCPYWPPEPWRERYAGWYEGALQPQTLCGPPTFLRLIQDGSVGPTELDYINDLYDAEVAAADEVIGAFLDRLRERGLLDTSLVVFTSDHGESLGNKRRVGHGSLVDEILRVPLLIRFPGGRWRGEHTEPVELVDLVPTLLTGMGIDGPEGVQGRDLLPLIRGEGPGGGTRMRVAQANDNYSVHFDQRWKLNFGFVDGELARQALYDLERDPGETANLYGTAKGRERFERLLDRFLSWRGVTRAEDERLYGGTSSEHLEADARMLEALGYTGNEGGG